MKIHLIKQQGSGVKGYMEVVYMPYQENSSVESRLTGLANVLNNESEFIMASEILDDFPLNQIGELIQYLLSKLRLKGSIVVGGTDIRLFCKSVVNSTINEPDAANVIKDKQSMTNVNDVSKLLQSLGLSIQTTQILGNHYEITAVRV